MPSADLWMQTVDHYLFLRLSFSKWSKAWCPWLAVVGCSSFSTLTTIWGASHRYRLLCCQTVCSVSSAEPVPAGSLSRGGDVTAYVLDIIQLILPTLLFCSCVCFWLYGPFTCISLKKIFSRQLSTFSLCSSGHISAVLVLSTIIISLWMYPSALI